MSLRMTMRQGQVQQAVEDDAQELPDMAVDRKPNASGRRAPVAEADVDFTDLARPTDRIDVALAEMRDFLSMTHPTTDAEALHSLRIAFPTVPLTDRIAAIKTRFFA